MRRGPAVQIIPVFLLSIVILLFVALSGGCESNKGSSAPAAVKEIRPGLLEGYLSPEEFPNSLELLPAPPEEGSAAFALDKETSQRSLALRGTPGWEQANRDADLMFPEAANAFAGVLDVPISEEDTPHLYLLLRRTLTDAGLSTYAAKVHYVRTRPFMTNNQPLCTPAEEELLRNDGSYPSGHSAVGWAWALILCEIFPEHTDAILARGRAFGESRMICNVHWQSDVNEGRFMGAATVARLHAEPEFLTDIKVVKTEIATIRALETGGEKQSR